MLFILSNIVSFGQEKTYEKFSRHTQSGILYGIKNKKTQKEIIPAIYNQITNFDKYFAVEKNNFLGVIDTLNQEKLPFKYVSIYFLDDNKMDRFVVSEGKFNYITNESGEQLGNTTFDSFINYNDGIVQFRKNNKIGYCNIDGKLILEPKFDSGDISKNGFIVTYTNKWNSLGYDLVTYNILGQEIQRQDIGMTGKYPLLFNKNGKLLFKGESYEDIKLFDNKELAIAIKQIPKTGNIRYIFINPEGKTIAYFDEYYSMGFYDDYIKIQKGYNSLYGLMDYEGNILFPPNFKEITNFTYDNNKLAKIIFYDNEYFYIDKEMKCVQFENKKCPDLE